MTQQLGNWWKITCDIVTDRMKEFTRPFVTGLVHDVPGAPLEIGTGSYIDRGQVRLLTCQHVIRRQPQAHQPLGNLTLVPIANTWRSDPHPIDAAEVSIDAATWGSIAEDALPISMSQFVHRHNPVNSEVLFFRGLAGQNAFLGFGQFSSIVTGYSSQEKPNSGDDQIFEMLWDPPQATITSQTDSTVRKGFRHDNPEGFSGSLVWNTRFVETGCDLRSWHPAHARVTGLLRRWDLNAKTLLAWRVEHLLAWF